MRRTPIALAIAGAFGLGVAFAGDGPEWPPELLPMVAAPDQYRLLFENEHVRVMEVVNPPGGVAPAHVHVWPSMFITLSPAHLTFRDREGAVVQDVPRASQARVVQWFGASRAPRSVENADDVTLRALQARSRPSRAAECRSVGRWKL